MVPTAGLLHFITLALKAIQNDRFEQSLRFPGIAESEFTGEHIS